VDVAGTDVLLPMAAFLKRKNMSILTKSLPLLRIAAIGMLSFGAAALTSAASAMELAKFGNTIILSGPVNGSEWAMVKDAFAANPHIDLVVLRNSHGGEAGTGYEIGEFFRKQGVTTAVSGYCVSSCSRMFLGGKTRLFTDDYPLDQTRVGFHGHYDAQGNLNGASVIRGGLYDWILKYSDGKADPELVKRWIAIRKHTGAASFFHPDLAATLGHSVFFCDGEQRQKVTSCEPIPTDAMQRGVITDTRRIASPDQDTLPSRMRARQFSASGFAAVEDVTKVPLDAPQGIEQYRKYLLASTPKAFAVSPSGRQWGWKSGSGEDVNAQALQRCEERAGQACVLYGVDDNVVYKK
jgi:hypothetical protein